jgi:hypothetical protein
MINGKCHCCFEQKDLQDSHVWPKFAYKRFVANLQKGGQFVDLHKHTLSSHQYTRNWFCRECEGVLSKTEAYAVQILTKMERDPTKDHPYDERLLPFITSISWRSLKFQTAGDHPRSVEGPWKAASVWRRYLLGKQGGVKAYTQHVYNIIDNSFGLDKMLGGVVLDKWGLALSQIGPLIIVGILEPEKLTDDERAVWDNSKVRSSGGVIKPLVDWRSWKNGQGQAHRHNITRRFAFQLMSFQMNLGKQARACDLPVGTT